MKKFLFGALLLATSALGESKTEVSTADQAKIYLQSAYSLATNLGSKIDRLQYIACKDADVLLLINKALTAPEINAAALALDPFTLRNLEDAVGALNDFANICKDGGIIDSEKPTAQKLADRIGMYMSQE